MKPERYNPKAKEAYAKSLIDTGVAAFKGVVLLATLTPVTFIAKAGLDGKISSVNDLPNSISFGMLCVVVAFLGIGLLFGAFLRDRGVRVLHEMEKKGNTITDG